MHPPGAASDSNPLMPARWSRSARAMIAAALALSVTLNVLLARRLQILTSAKSLAVADRSLKVGATVPPINAKRLNGGQEVISYQNTAQPTVLYILRPGCVWCTRNMDNFRTLLSDEAGQYRFVGLSLTEDGLSEYLEKNKLSLTVYSGLSKQTKDAYKLSGTPQTIVVSPEGRVLQNWIGAYAGEQQTQVEQFFHVELPGLRPGA